MSKVTSKVKNSKLGNIEVLIPTCNPSTVRDGRGGIFTWVPEEPIKEFNLLYFRPGKVRGNHHHPEFTEYFLIVAGEGVMVTKESTDGPDLVMHASKGTCFRTPANTVHAFHAITEATCLSFLTKPWEECDPPIVHDFLIPYDTEYREYAKEQGFKNSVEELRTKEK